jgi:hypothetical protein
MTEIDRLLMEFDHADYDQLLGFFPVPILREICSKVPYFAKFPWVADPAEFAYHVERVQTRSALEFLLSSLEEPPAEELRDIIELLRDMAPTAKRILAAMTSSIRQVGGPEEKLADPVTVRQIYNEVWDAVKNGDSRKAAMERVAKREGVGLKTVQRRIADERKRRASLKQVSDSVSMIDCVPIQQDGKKPEDLLK